MSLIKNNFKIDLIINNHAERDGCDWSRSSQHTSNFSFMWHQQVSTQQSTYVCEGQVTVVWLLTVQYMLEIHLPMEVKTRHGPKCGQPVESILCLFYALGLGHESSKINSISMCNFQCINLGEWLSYFTCFFFFITNLPSI